MNIYVYEAAYNPQVNEMRGLYKSKAGQLSFCLFQQSALLV